MKWFLFLIFITELGLSSDEIFILSRSKMWLRLLHYEQTILGQMRSQVKDPRFFIHSNGYKDPFSEMSATLNEFFSKEKLDDQHAICRFPARLRFLKSNLKSNFDWTKLPEPKCVYYRNFKMNLNAQSVSFVFSSYYANNPSSAFGHTFFRVNRKERVSGNTLELLDYGVSYAANISTENPILYVLYGLFGGFTGTYASVPYYYKVREYNDYDSRDLWSYELNMSPLEIEQFVDHLWEVGPQYFDYYFFTQNCSFHMLTLLEASIEKIELTDRVPFYVIPSDAIAAIVREKDLIRKITFRPSLRRQFQSKWSSLNEKEKKVAKSKLESLKDGQSNNKVRADSDNRQALILDTLLDFTDLKDPKNIHRREGPWYAIKQSLLLERSAIQIVSPEIQIEQPDDDRPDRAHPSARFTVGLETFSKHSQIRYLGLRFAFHDLLDNSLGLPKYSQVEFGHFEWRHQNSGIKWNYFSLFNLLQINPVTEMEHRLSWGVDVGGQSIPSLENSFSPGLKVLGGVAVELDKSLLWILPFLHYRYSSAFETEPHYSALGLQVGYLLTLTTNAKTLLKYEQENPAKRESFSAISITGRYHLDFNISLEVEWGKVSISQGEDQETSKLKVHYYF